MSIDRFVGEYNNFQQYWQENTEEEMHRVVASHPHEHRHLECLKTEEANKLLVKLYAGRAKENLISEQTLKFRNNELASDSPGFFKLKDGDIYLSGFGFLEDCLEAPYVFKPCRYFSGWIQYPPDIKDPDELYSLRDLEIHDQGGYAELDVEGVDYTVELTQLVYAKTLRIMKLAIYDIPKSEVGINSKAISYAWVEPDAKRIGINVRKVLSGWTFIEPGYISSNNNLNKNS